MAYAWKNKKGKWLILKQPSGFQTRVVAEFTRNINEATVCGYHHIPRGIREDLQRFEARVDRKVVLLENDNRGSGLYRTRR